MEEKREFAAEVARQLRKNYTQLAEIERITKELGDALSANDRESVQLLLGMRKDEMDKAEKTKHDIYVLLEAADEGTRDEIRSLLNGSGVPSDLCAEYRAITETNAQIKRVLERSISIDKVISRKLAGKDSFYQS